MSCGSPGSEVSFAHATSADLRGWTVQPEVLHVTGVWPETSHVFAPYVIGHEGAFYMLYAAVDERGTQRLSLATSTDLFAWERWGANPVIVPSLSWARWPGFDQPDDAMGNCRDPHILRLEDGTFVAYWVAEMQARFGPDMTCVAASISRDLRHWQEVGPVLQLQAGTCRPRAPSSPPASSRATGVTTCSCSQSTAGGPTSPSPTPPSTSAVAPWPGWASATPRRSSPGRGSGGSRTAPATPATTATCRRIAPGACSSVASTGPPASTPVSSPREPGVAPFAAARGEPSALSSDPMNRAKWEQRWHPLRQEWVVIAAHRQDRPWRGETVAQGA
ncbi:MAG: hypothetical protein HY684_02420, partial [Chloroflexi bacterium]|nr:hypothetical protein [Chloroflexota bacterium]